MKTQQIDYIKYATAVIRIAAENGLEIDETETFESIFTDADNFIRNEEPLGHEFVQLDFSSHGYNQGYTFADECGYFNTVSGDIFDFSYHYKKEDNRLFRKDGDTFTPVAWYDIPDDEERENYVFVFDYQTMSNGKLAYLYDYFAV